MLKFFYNGIKDSSGKLQRAWFSKGGFTRFPEETIAIYKRGYEPYSAEVRAAFAVVNHLDHMTDYFESDTIYVFPDHPLYAQVRAAYEKDQERVAKRAAKMPKATWKAEDMA